jgi:carboxylate-amine ligase
MPDLDHQFGTGTPFSIGVEEELFLVDPLTGRLINSSNGVVAAVAEVNGRVDRELHACQIELITDVLSSASEVAPALGALRAAVLATGAGILGAGTHPSAEEGDAEITDKDRYERIRDLLGDAVITPISGLHVHVGMPDAETAIRVFNGLRGYLPLVQALASNSPFRHGRDTGLASARDMTMRGWPRSGLPRAFRDFHDFSQMADEVTRAAGVPDYTWFWWKLRPHPRLGTVEIRTLDAQTSVDDVASLTALVHCLARALADRETQPGLSPEVLQESIFRASRFGVHGELIGGDGEPRPVSELLDAVIADVGGYAEELGCAAELAALPRLVSEGGAAGRQRSIFEIAGIGAVTRTLAEQTAAAAAGAV